MAAIGGGDFDVLHTGGPRLRRIGGELRRAEESKCCGRDDEGRCVEQHRRNQTLNQQPPASRAMPSAGPYERTLPSRTARVGEARCTN